MAYFSGMSVGSCRRAGGEYTTLRPRRDASRDLIRHTIRKIHAIKRAKMLDTKVTEVHMMLAYPRY